VSCGRGHLVSASAPVALRSPIPRLIRAIARRFAKIYEEEEEPPQIEAVTGRSLFTDEFSTDQAETAISSLHRPPT
jgi:hypothetical protein